MPLFFHTEIILKNLKLTKNEHINLQEISLGKKFSKMTLPLHHLWAKQLITYEYQGKFSRTAHITFRGLFVLFVYKRYFPNGPWSA